MPGYKENSMGLISIPNMVKPEEHAEGVREAPDGGHVAYGPPGAAAGGVVHLLYPGRAQARVILTSLLLLPAHTFNSLISLISSFASQF